MTVTDLANDLSVNKSAVYKHLSRLLDAGLVRKLEDNRKWVYYRLSMKGMHLLHPERVQIALMLSAAVLAVTLALSQIYSFLVGTEVTRWVPDPEGVGGGIGGSFVIEIVHEPLLLVVGALLIAVGAVLVYMALHLREGAKARAAI
jgi:DNA-binding transcriptional ArsR family regulator